jgi:hypothetical protein
MKVDHYADEPDYEEESLITGDGVVPNVNYAIKFSAGNHCFVLQSKSRLLLNIRYAYLYLYHRLNAKQK